RVAWRQRLVLEDVEASAFDAVRCQGLDHGFLVNDRAAADVDDDGSGFHDSELGVADHVPIFLGEGRGSDHVIPMPDNLFQVRGRQIALDNRIAIIRIGGNGSTQGEDAHSHGANAGGDGATDVTVADDADNLTADFLDIKRLPTSLRLIADHASKIFCEV